MRTLFYFFLHSQSDILCSCLMVASFFKVCQVPSTIFNILVVFSTKDQTNVHKNAMSFF